MRALTQLVWWCVIGPLYQQGLHQFKCPVATDNVVGLVEGGLGCRAVSVVMAWSEGWEHLPSFVRIPVDANGCVALYSYVGEVEQDGCMMTDCFDLKQGMGVAA